jgi:hypothetical protein
MKNPPPLPNKESLYVELTRLMLEGRVEFCECQAGKMLELSLVNLQRRLEVEERQLLHALQYASPSHQHVFADDR